MHLEKLPFLDEYYNRIYIINNTEAIVVSKDVDFNFGIKSKGKYRHFVSILEEKNGKQYISRLNDCKDATHTLCNFSLFPGTGAMNTAKEWGEDRIDTFIYCLDLLIKDIKRIGAEKVYEEFIDLVKQKNVPLKYRLLNSFVGRNGKNGIEAKYRLKEKLIKYLSQYDDVYSYCEDWYLWYDETKEFDVRRFIDENILNGKSIIPFNEPEDVIRYMDIAEFFWKVRKKHYLNAGISEDEIVEINKMIASFDK